MIFDVLIVGGGPAGSTVAQLLAKAGWSVALVEKKIFPRNKVCGEFISATSFPLLQKLNLEHFYLTNGGPEIRRVSLFASDTILTSAMPDFSNLWGRALGREQLDTLLLDKAKQASAILWQPANVKSIERQNDVFLSTIVSENKTEHMTSRFVIMANGSWEKGPAFYHHYSHQPSDLLAFKAHFLNGELPLDVISLLAFPGGYGGMVNSDHGRMTFSCCIRRDILQNARMKYPGLSAGDVVLKHVSHFCLGVRRTLSIAERIGHWQAVGPIRPGIRQCYRDGIFFVGNIAGEAHPIIADGISMAMQSSWLLSQVLLDAKNIMPIESLGQVYTQEWNRHFKKRIRAAALFAQFAMRPWVVTSLLPIMQMFPGLLTFGAKLSGKINQVGELGPVGFPQN
jgi:flavin-dependent dehydrogenase